MEFCSARQESIPQGLKPLRCCGLERAKAEALAYLEATAKTKDKKAKTKYGGLSTALLTMRP